MPDNDIVVMEDVRLVFRNFTGKEGQYNQEGARNFGVILPDNIASAMERDGWNVKYLQPRETEDEEEATPWLPVKINYRVGRPPQIYTITSRGKTLMTEETVEQLDWAEITNVDLIVRPFHYDVGGRSGIAAYVQTLYATIEEDPLQRKYAELDAQ